MQVEAQEGHGWWPYAVPYIAYFVLTVVGDRLPDGAAPLVLAVKPGVVLALVLWFRGQGAYPEWRKPDVRMTPSGLVQDVAVGLALTAVWVAPFLLFPGLRPEPGAEFDPGMAGAEWIPGILALRLFGYALVTPIFEELFIRSFVMRVAAVWETEHDFRNEPLGRYSLQSLIVTTIVFTITHAFWEWWVCVPWIVLSNLWFYHRRSLTALMVVHATTNGALLALAVFGEGWLRDANGAPFSFWFFV
ncbi:MAG: CPBP family glutamic-type intramembrane protease [Myxococcota bacterium]